MSQRGRFSLTHCRRHHIMATWVVGDIHGCYNEFMALLDKTGNKADDTFILIGDIVDRGPDTHKMLDWAMENVTPDGHFQMICGNHENNIIDDYDRERKVYKDIFRDGGFGSLGAAVLACHYGFDIYMRDEGYETIRDLRPFIMWFKKLPLTKRVTVMTSEGKEQEYVIAHGWYGKNLKRMGILWDRDIDDKGHLKEDYHPVKNEILVHGHTPVFIELGYPEDGRVHFREHSINVDCGCVYGVRGEIGGRLAALRLEDRKVIYQDPV